MNMAALLQRTAERWPDNTAIVDLDAPGGRKELNYADVFGLVTALAAYLRSAGLHEGDRVALLMRNSFEYLVSFYAVAAAGFVVVPLNVRLLPPELDYIVVDTGSRMLIADEDLLAANERLAQITDRGVIVTRSTEEGRWPGWSDVIDGAGELPPVDSEPDRLLSIIYTSGTTGNPKGVMLPHRAWIGVSTGAIEHLGYQEGEEATLAAAPVTHGAGFFVLPTFETGGRNVLMRKFDAPRILDVFEQEGITNLHVVPTMIRLLLDARTHKDDRIGSRVKAVSYAGAPIDVVTMREAIEAFGGALVQSFGQMEFPMFMTVLTPSDHAAALSTRPELLLAAGRPTGSAKVRIVNDEGSDVGPGETGEIAGSGPLSMLGYWNKPEATADTFRAGWVHTGDMGRIDENGYLYVSGRKKDMIISGGMNVYAREVEDVLVQIDGVKAAAVIGVPHRVWGEAVVAILIPEEGTATTSDVVLEACHQRLPGYRCPKEIRWVREFPENSYGKVLKRQLQLDFAGLEKDAEG